MPAACPIWRQRAANHGNCRAAERSGELQSSTSAVIASLIRKLIVRSTLVARAAGLLRADAARIALADPHDVEDADQLGVLVQVEPEQAVAGAEHGLAEPYVGTWRLYCGVPWLVGQFDGLLDQGLACILGQGVELNLCAAAELNAIGHLRGRPFGQPGISWAAGTTADWSSWAAASRPS